MRDKVRKRDQIATLHKALGYVKDFTVAIDGGANVGDWLAVMLPRFAFVHAFEPNKKLFELLSNRFAGAAYIYHAALWSHKCQVTLNDFPRAPTKDRAKFCTEGGDIDAVSIDSLCLPSCGLIKLDLEGAELKALNGAKQTIKTFRPVLVIECKTNAASKLNEEKPGQFLKPLGYSEAFRYGPDRVYIWAT